MDNTKCRPILGFKKFLSYCAIALFITACGGGSNNNDDNQNTNTQHDTTQQENKDAPSAFAGANQSVKSAARVTLAGSATGVNAPFTYQWTQTTGSDITLSDSTITNPSFTAPIVVFGNTELLTFELAVMDSAGVSAKASVIITVLGQTVASTTRATRFEFDLDNNGVTDEVLTYTYDTNGRVTKDQRVYTDDGVVDLFKLANNNGTIITDITYDANGKMTALSSQSETNLFFIDYVYTKTGLLERAENTIITNLKDLPDYDFSLYRYTNDKLSGYSNYQGEFNLTNQLQTTNVISYDANGRFFENKNETSAVRYTWDTLGRLTLVEEDNNLDSIYETSTENIYGNTGLISKKIFINEVAAIVGFSNYTVIFNYDSNNAITTLQYDNNNDGSIDAIGKVTATENGPCVGIYIPAIMPQVGLDGIPGSNSGDLALCN